MKHVSRLLPVTLLFNRLSLVCTLHQEMALTKKCPGRMVLLAPHDALTVML